MSQADCQTGAVCKQRFKGIENFLKRLAFNLGNTPSQTEVKIISCIPIDVTDLQQKIIHLEKQLDEARNCSPSQSKIAKGSKRTAVNTAFINSNFTGATCAAVSCNSLDCDRGTSPACMHCKRKSNVSFDEHITANNSDTSQGVIVQPHEFGAAPPTNTAMDEPMTMTDHRRNFFKKKKKILKNKKGKSPYVYYAHTENSPFNRSEMTDDFARYESSDFMSRSYLAKMVNKQYKPQLFGDNISIMSQFSSPVCRDDRSHCKDTCHVDNDICSCCHGQFHNIDEHIGRFNNVQTYMVNEIKTGNAYYDTNQYDLVPVKEKPTKIKKDIEMSRKKDTKAYIDMKCWPENVRSKYRQQLLYSPQRNNYYTVRPRTEYTFREKVDYYGRKMPMKINKIEPIINKKVAKRRKEIYRRERPINIETSKSCSIDFGSVYSKKARIRHEYLQPVPVPRKNAECLTETLRNNNECQTAMNVIEANLADAKTEATLNQIKSILQSVLAEVKESALPKNPLPELKPKKDAVVQKGQSHNNMQASSLMNSLTYSPYAINPTQYNMASCSRQLNNQFCHPNSGMKCFQNFPLFIQNPGRQMCASCYRNTSQFKTGYMKQATTIATNTDVVKEERSKETEKLIKEIYKSMALTMDMPNKDTSMSEYDDYSKSTQGFTTPIILKAEPKKPPKIMKNVVQAVSELFMKKDMADTSETVNTTIESKLPSMEASTRSQLVTTDTEVRLRKDRLEKYLRNKNMQAVPELPKRAIREPIAQNVTHNTITETQSETSSSETESETTLIVDTTKDEDRSQGLKQKKERKGLLSKMFKSVKMFMPKDKVKRKSDKTESEEEATSDSDDYQTVYSQKIEKTLKHRPRPHNLPKRKTHSKISYKQTYQRDRSPEKKRSPYMEQEYRRYWNERLMFQDNRQKHSSERMYSERSAPKKPAYYQSYEARSALVDQQPRVVRNPRVTRANDDDDKKLTSKGMAWLKKHKMGIHCGEQWKKLILEG